MAVPYTQLQSALGPSGGGKSTLLNILGGLDVPMSGGEQQRVNVIADFVDSPGALGDVYRIKARIVIWESEDVMLVPSSALFRRGQGWGVFVIENGQARQRAVEVGHRTAIDVELRQGLAEGAEVILHPTNQMTDGLRVKTW